MTTVNVLEPVVNTRKSARRLTFRRFRPRLSLVYQQELLTLANRVTGMHANDAYDCLVEAIAEADERYSRLLSYSLTSLDLMPTVQYATILRVLRDLLVQGWEVRGDDEGVILDLPGRASFRVADPEHEKEALRRSFSFARDTQLAKATTRTFIETMERRGIGSVFADGSELAERLTASGPKGIRPFVEVISQPSDRDDTTGLRLQEIWRYARLYWSIPYQSTPGRNIFFLIRDTATEERPLIGIAALGNPVLGLAQRDDFYGWSTHGLAERLSSMSNKERNGIAAHLCRVIERGITETYADDLPMGEDGEWRDVVKALKITEKQSAAERLNDLQFPEGANVTEARLIHEADKARKKDPDSIDWQRIAESVLYRSKRAGTMADLTRAKGTFAELGFSRHGDPLKKALASEEGVRAIDIALRRIKQQVMTSSVMELITCGAVPPYREVLGGKLVAMLMLSDEVVTAFRERYSNQASLITSGLAGRAIYREPRLALITTSSLYAVGSSQYNRIKIPVGKHDVAYKRIGRTKSFGTVQFDQDTIEHLSVVAQLADSNRRQVNYVFGEGASPKLRFIRAGLDALGLHSDTFLQHHSPRLLYGAALCSNIKDVVLGIDEKVRYILPPGSEGTELIIKHWRHRWLSKRASRPDILELLRGRQFLNFRLSNEISIRATDTHQEKPIAAEEGAGLKGSRKGGGDEKFIERLYRSSKSYADRMSPDELEAIHVDLGVDEYLVNQAKRGRQIVITGNPGDGKTHLIERLSSMTDRCSKR